LLIAILTWACLTPKEDYQERGQWFQSHQRHRLGAGPRRRAPYLPAELRKLFAMEMGELAADYRQTKRHFQPPKPDEPEMDNDDFERRVLRWIR
jgi:hypothetical protein